MIVVPVFDVKRKDNKIIRINNHQYWVGFINFYVVPEKIFEAAPGKYLDYSYWTINAIYTSHNNVLKKKLKSKRTARREAEKEENRVPHWKQTVGQLMDQNQWLTNIEITNLVLV